MQKNYKQKKHLKRAQQNVISFDNTYNIENVCKITLLIE